MFKDMMKVELLRIAAAYDRPALSSSHTSSWAFSRFFVYCLPCLPSHTTSILIRLM